MKLPIIVSAGMISATVAYNAYALTCGAQPSCDSLGYKYTGATTDCLNEPLKCPFNSSYFNCVKKTDAINKLQQDIVTAAMPDYSKAVSRNNNMIYTAATNGFIFGFDAHQNDSGSCSSCNTVNINISINGVNVRVDPSQTNWARNSWSYPVRKGSTYKVSFSSSELSMIYYFVPTIQL